jgi:glycosyltransferase involved in cell wall biosynthesis
LEPLATSHEIRVISSGEPAPFGSPPSDVDLRLITIPDEPEPAKEPWLRKNLLHYVKGPPWLWFHAMHHVRALAAEALNQIPDFRPDLIQIEHAEQLLPLQRLLPPGVPIVLVLHNIPFSIQYQLLDVGSPWERFKAALELPLVVRQTRKDLTVATASITVTEHDRRLAKRLAPRAVIKVVPNCVNAAYFRREGARAEAPTLIMTGSFHYQPNQGAAKELIEGIWPRLKSRIPNAQLVLVGQRMPAWLSAAVARTDGVTAIGQVEDLRPQLWKSWVAVAPLRKGSGSPLKVMEALAAGVPVVTTSRVARALGVSIDDGVVTADSTRGLVEAICALLEDTTMHRTMVERGEITARTKFDRSVAADLQQQVWSEALAASR